jgi:hypothetical protein
VNTIQRRKRVEAIENVVNGNGGKVWVLWEFLDGHFEGPDPKEVHPGDIVLHIVTVEAKDGRPIPEDELEVIFPGRRDRLKASHAAWAGKIRAPASESDLLL